MPSSNGDDARAAFPRLSYEVFTALRVCNSTFEAQRDGEMVRLRRRGLRWETFDTFSEAAAAHPELRADQVQRLCHESAQDHEVRAYEVEDEAMILLGMTNEEKNLFYQEKARKA